MKGKIHVPVEQYGFIEVEFDDTWTESMVAEQYEVVKAQFNRPINEMPAKEWDSFWENWLKGIKNHTETLDKMSPQQRNFYNTMKRARDRAESKSKKESTYWGAMPPHLLDGGQSD